ncbi:MAG: adenine deaminase [Ginsengibacter sp.]
MDFKIKGNFVDIENERIYAAEISVKAGAIYSITTLSETADSQLDYILPGFVDAHVHIESSMLVPSEFARLAVVHGTVATVSDPHEIANVCGLAGVQYMIDNGKTVPFKFHFGAPSCVPATCFETAGAMIAAEDIKTLMANPNIFYLSEMMNYPGVINNDPEILKKIKYAQENDKPVDGHAPAVSGKDLVTYVSAGISTDHECFTREEAEEKLSLGMKILIREGSAAKNFESLIDLLNDHADEMMFCSDDKHPDSLLEGHINLLCKRAVEKGIDLFKILKAACINPVRHYKLKVGLLHVNEPADFIVVKSLKGFEILKTFINGVLVAVDGNSLINRQQILPLNNFNCGLKRPSDFIIKAYEKNKTFEIIEATDEQLITNKLIRKLASINNEYVSDPQTDILKMVVINRYAEEKPSLSFVKNFGLKSGAIASSVAHDSHNIICVGVDDQSICNAINNIILTKGGISLVNDETDLTGITISLPIGGLMSDQDGKIIAELYTQIDLAAKKLGSKLSSPFMTLSFMALLVIPHLKLSNFGLFDVDQFQLVD